MNAAPMVHVDGSQYILSIIADDKDYADIIRFASPSNQKMYDDIRARGDTFSICFNFNRQEES